MLGANAQGKQGAQCRRRGDALTTNNVLTERCLQMAFTGLPMPHLVDTHEGAHVQQQIPPVFFTNRVRICRPMH